MEECECSKVTLRRSVSAGSLSFAGLSEWVKVALRRSVSAGSLSFLLRQGFGERVGGLSECVKVALRRSVSAGSLSFAGLSERSNARKRSKLWGSDSANDASRVAGRD